MGPVSIDHFARLWLLVTVCFELPTIKGLLFSSPAYRTRVKGSRSTNFVSHAEAANAVSRWHVTFLSLLVATRVVVFFNIKNSGLWTLCAVVHVVEAWHFGCEWFLQESRDADPILAAIMAQAAFYVWYAASMVSQDVGPDKST
eukprot:gnl/TRDRNA2_/TRDRNA2_35826_c0_seq1.p2 gnl/TRDRNA2_/TRDRNA2_35826_c0~~gnl/TRDRNA2_/TRDRNA2_35826_c0_seq1.p2  ORF type:complete len:144 (+),score=18.07 gnl/TRDRNA2_/TRDRNA2_35826_c0_seq1:16-447(+)